MIAIRRFRRWSDHLSNEPELHGIKSLFCLNSPVIVIYPNFPDPQNPSLDDAQQHHYNNTIQKIYIYHYK